MKSGDIEYTHAKHVESTLKASVTILNEENIVLNEFIPAYLLGGMAH